MFSIRGKLTLWYGGVMAIILACFSVSVLLMTQRHLIALIDAPLARALDGFADRIVREGVSPDLSGRLDLAYPPGEGFSFRVITERGKTLLRTRNFHLGIFADPPKVASDRVSFVALRCDYGGSVENFRLASRLVRVPEGPVIVQALGSLRIPDQALGDLRSVLLLIGPTALAAALAGGFLLARRALAPVDRMTAAAAEITSMRLNRRLDAPIPDDELGRLAATLNGMIERLERSFEEVRRFTADAAHELRTPLSLMRTEIEVALRDAPGSWAGESLLEGLLEEIDRLTRLVTQLLFLCREDAGLRSGAFRPVCLGDIVVRVADHVQVAAAERDQSFEVRIIAPCRVLGDEDRLRQLLFNLLDNAVKYTPPGGSIVVVVGPADGQARVTVTDSGIGIPTEHVPHVFSRFYRVDPSRGQEAEGTGLGLSICRSIAESHGGRLRLESDAGRGTSAILSIPLDPTSGG